MKTVTHALRCAAAIVVLAAVASLAPASPKESKPERVETVGNFRLRFEVAAPATLLQGIPDSIDLRGVNIAVPDNATLRMVLYRVYPAFYREAAPWRDRAQIGTRSGSVVDNGLSYALSGEGDLASGTYELEIFPAGRQMRRSDPEFKKVVNLLGTTLRFELGSPERTLADLSGEMNVAVTMLDEAVKVAEEALVWYTELRKKAGPPETVELFKEQFETYLNPMIAAQTRSYHLYRGGIMREHFRLLYRMFAEYCTTFNFLGEKIVKINQWGEPAKLDFRVFLTKGSLDVNKSLLLNLQHFGGLTRLRIRDAAVADAAQDWKVYEDAVDAAAGIARAEAERLSPVAAAALEKWVGGCEDPAPRAEKIRAEIQTYLPVVKDKQRGAEAGDYVESLRIVLECAKALNKDPHSSSAEAALREADQKAAGLEGALLQRVATRPVDEAQVDEDMPDENPDQPDSDPGH